MVLKYAEDGINKFGKNIDVDTALEDIWDGGGTYVFPTEARIHDIVSDDTADDGVATGTLTLVSAVAITPATGTVVCASVLAADTVTVNGLLYTAVAGAKANNEQFSIDTGDDECATDLADSITNDTRTGTLNDVTAVSSTDTVTMTQTVAGLAGDATTLVSSNGTRLAVSGATFSGGLDADVATVNGLTYTGVAGAKSNNTEFSVDTSDTLAAADLVDSITNDTRPPVTVPTAVIVATSAVGVVTINSAGSIGNLVDIAGTSNITASGATLTDVGTGAHTLEIQGILADGAAFIETIALNGTTVVPTLTEFLAINRMIVKSAGSGGANAGVITATAQTDSTVTAQINDGNNQTEMAIYTIPLGVDVMLTEYYVGVGKTTSAFVDGSLMIKPFGEVFQTKHTIPASSTGETNSDHQFNPWAKVEQRGIIKIRAISSAVNTVVFAGFDLIFSNRE